MEDRTQSPEQIPIPEPSQTGETPPQLPGQPVPVETAPPQPEPIILSKLFPDAKTDLDALFPDPQMKELLKEVHKTRQGNERFLKRLNLSRIEEEDESPSEP